MDNNINFKGAFLISKVSPDIKKALSPALTGKKHIYTNFMKKDDILYVVRDSADIKVGNAILGIPNIKFKYFPKLNTKSGFETKNYRGASKIIQEYTDEIITTKEKLLSKIKKPVKPTKANIYNIQEKNIKLIQKETKLDFSDSKYTKNIDKQNGICTIKAPVTDYNGNTENKTVLRISPPGKFGISYAEYTPLSPDEPVRRIAINKYGKKIFEYVSPFTDADLKQSTNKFVPNAFENNFKSAKKYYKEQIAKRLNTVG